MLSISNGSESVHKTPLETNLVRDDYIKAVVNDSIVALLGELLKIGHDVVIERNE